MTDPKAKAIPEWQRKESNSSVDQEPSDNTATDATAQTGAPETVEEAKDSRAELLSQASEFLLHPDIKDASTDKKISFLETKGLTNTEIHSLLGISRNDSTSSSSSASSSSSPSEPPPPPSTSSALTQAEQSSRSTSPSAPPIITYPEFLLHASSPPPLITTPRLLTTLYISALVSGSVYVANKLLFSPMLEDLTTARHTLYTSTQENISTLNEKLSSTVSVIPPDGKEGQVKGDKDDKDDGESSIASDPSELFSRDAGVQTSPSDLVPGLSQSANPFWGATAQATQNPRIHQQNKLKELHKNLEEVSESSTDALDADTEARARMSELKGMLEDMAYGRGSGGLSGLRSGGTSGGFDLRTMSADGPGGMWTGKKEESGEDEVAKMRAEIKSFKGLLLSARSFPAGNGVGRR